MVKGVNKQIIEINGEDSDYFDRAILFVKPERKFLTKKNLEKQANSYVSGLEGKSVKEKKPFFSKTTVLKYLAAAAGSSLLTSIIMAGIL